MKEHDTKGTTETTIGMDLGDKYCQICVLDEGGEILEESRIRTTEVGVRGYFGLRPTARVVLEVGTHSPWISRLVSSCHHEVIVANPRRVQLIAQNNQKTDSTDAELLARLGRADPKLLSPVVHRQERTQKHLAMIRARDAQVRSRTQLINAVRGLVKGIGQRMPKCSASAFCKKTDVIPVTLSDVFGAHDGMYRQIDRVLSVTTTRALKRAQTKAIQKRRHCGKSPVSAH